MHALNRFVTLPAHRRAIAAEAVIALGLARLLVLTVPIRWIARRFGRRPAPPHAQPTPLGDVVREVGWAVRAAASRTPWKSACLAQAIAGKWMLARRGVQATIRLGVAKDADGTLHAHAWLCAGDAVLTGGGQMRRFTLLGDLE